MIFKGLSVLRSLKAKGITNVTAFEKSDRVGGVWRANYLTCALQVPKEFYEFPSFPFKVPRGSFPSREKIEEYIEDFTKEHDLQKNIQLNANVTKVTREGKGWSIEVEGKGKQYVDYCIVATGMYSAPYLPELPNKSSFKGTILHSTEFRDAAQVKDKNVVVVGAGKSAIDCVLACQQSQAKSATLLYRQAHWGTPLKIAGVIPFQFVFLSRFGQSLVSLYKGVWPSSKSSALKASHAVLAPVMMPVFKIVEWLFAIQLGHQNDFTPDRDVVKDFYVTAAVLTPEFKRQVNKGGVRISKGEIDGVTGSNEIKTKKGEVLGADVLIFATGFQKTYDYFDTQTKQDLDRQKDGLYLYRQILPVNVANLAFCGSELVAISNITTYALQAEWIARAVAGDMKLASKEEMAKEVETVKQWKRGWMEDTQSRAANSLLHQIHYNDSLMEDMGMERKRKSNLLAELFMPYESRDYDNIIKTN